MFKNSKLKKRFFKIISIVIIALVTASLIILFTIVPSFVAKRFNPVGDPEKLEVITPESQALHQSLTIVDLHADSLLWGRDMSERSDNGHVDIPRMIEGNVALQIFATVTKVPTPLALENNSSDSDSIIKLAILQRWSPSTWFSLLERSIYQSKQLHSLQEKNPQTFRLIETQQDLNDYLTAREKQKITAGLLSVEGAHVLEGKLQNVDRLYDAGFRIIGLSHFFDNSLTKYPIC